MLCRQSYAVSSSNSSDKKTPNQPKHFFNAAVLSENEKQISIAGNMRFAISDRTEIGTQGLFLLSGIYNISAKHLMFEQPGWQTAFVAHSFFFSNETSEVDEQTDEETSISTNFSLTAMGIITSHRSHHNTQISWGLYDLFLSSRNSTDHTDVEGHFFAPTLAVDHQLGENWFLTGTLSYATYVYLNIESDTMDGSLDANLLSNNVLDIDPVISFLTLTFQQDAFNFEFGALRVPGSFLPYFNIFWRFI